MRQHIQECSCQKYDHKAAVECGVATGEQNDLHKQQHFSIVKAEPWKDSVRIKAEARLQTQLHAMVVRRKKANITPEIIQVCIFRVRQFRIYAVSSHLVNLPVPFVRKSHAQTMVQAAAKAQAVVVATKRGGFLPMNSAQITALSQTQAKVIVNAHSHSHQTALIGTTGSAQSEGGSGKSTNQQLLNQINIQAWALVYAYTEELARVIPLPIGDPKTSDIEIASGLAGDEFPDGWSVKTYRSCKGESVRRTTQFWFSRKSCFYLFDHCDTFNN